MSFSRRWPLCCGDPNQPETETVNNLQAYSCRTLGEPMVPEPQGQWYRRQDYDGEIKRLQAELTKAGDHPLVMEQGGTSNVDRCHRVINKQQARIAQLEGHLDWIGWGSEGIIKAKAEIERLQAVPSTDYETIKYQPGFYWTRGVVPFDSENPWRLVIVRRPCWTKESGKTYCEWYYLDRSGGYEIDSGEWVAARPPDIEAAEAAEGEGDDRA